MRKVLQECQGRTPVNPDFSQSGIKRFNAALKPIGSHTIPESDTEEKAMKKSRLEKSSGSSVPEPAAASSAHPKHHADPAAAGALPYFTGDPASAHS